MRPLTVIFTMCFLHTITLSKSFDEEELKKWNFDQSAKELVESQWEEFKWTYKKHYKSKIEDLYRMKIFIENSLETSARNQLYAKGLFPKKSSVKFYSDLLYRSLSNSFEKELGKWDFDLSAKDLAENRWEEFKLVFKKQYTSETEDLYRKKVYLENSIEISKRNQLYAQGLFSTKSGINQYSDFLYDELSEIAFGYRGFEINKSDSAKVFMPPAHVTLPKSVDWRNLGTVTKVKNQGYCASSYAFAATGALEGQHFRKTKTLVSLSQQNLVDCSTSYGNKGCKGGFISKSYLYIFENRGINTYYSYPYEGIESECRYNSRNRTVEDRGYMRIKSGNEQHLRDAVATLGPISVAINARQSFLDYKGGKVYFEPDCKSERKDLNHAVLVVGFGRDPKDPHPDYWIVKNSHGRKFGKKGYIRMARNEDNHCGIATDPFYPLV